MSKECWLKLKEPFYEKDIEWRIQQSGQKNGKAWALVLAYVTNRAIQERLDSIVGPDHWFNEYTSAPDGGVLCGISIEVEEGKWITKWDGAQNTDIEPTKGGLSGAMKRAAVQWGIGRYLYYLDTTFADINEKGRFFAKTKDGNFRWNPPILPSWALPEDAQKMTKSGKNGADDTPKQPESEPKQPEPTPKQQKTSNDVSPEAKRKMLDYFRNLNLVRDDWKGSDVAKFIDKDLNDLDGNDLQRLRGLAEAIEFFRSGVLTAEESKMVQWFMDERGVRTLQELEKELNELQGDPQAYCQAAIQRWEQVNND